MTAVRVLVVEDEPQIARAHAEYVTRIPGFTVTGVAGTAAAALSRVRRYAAAGTPVDLVLADVGLPDRSGLDLAADLADVTPRPDVMVITSARDIATVRGAMASGAILYLIKPFTFAAFADRLARYRSFREALSGDEVGQREVDAAFSALREAPSATSAPKGMAPSTMEAVTSALRHADSPLGAADVAARTGVSRVTAWRYLERLADDRLCERVTEYGGRGRPEIRYRWL
ncbi:response regulator [Tsukamurella sp. PLM1]|uniref:response regulator n=1 Tax=Tsukamurella sp. PLM1 TaxID=2929795 RepID=UPI002057D0C1|nr:response regulator [Tsukamurella sp. PLM1]BDH59115.1 transcriptional regulatory protein [Tsukamurella sp. PLM1]